MRSDARKRLTQTTDTTKDTPMDNDEIPTEIARTSRGLSVLEEALLERLEQTTATLNDYAEECERLRGKILLQSHELAALRLAAIQVAD